MTYEAVPDLPVPEMKVGDLIRVVDTSTGSEQRFIVWQADGGWTAKVIADPTNPDGVST